MPTIQLSAILALILLAHPLQAQSTRHAHGKGPEAPGGHAGHDHGDDPEFQHHPPRIGESLPDLTAFDEEGNEFPLSSLRGHYSVLILGCLTCPPFLRNIPQVETVFRDYAPKGVKFYYLYRALSHPGLKGYVNPYTFEERLMHVREAKRTLGSEIPWIVDGMDNTIKHELGGRSNPEFLIDPEGKVLYKRTWSDPKRLRRRLEEFVGPVQNPTRVADLDMRTVPPPQSAATGVIARLERPLGGADGMKPVRRVPELGNPSQPFYAKLRAEVDPALLKEGRGRLYLGFFMDPLYGVHWNNLSEPIHVRIEAPEGTTVSATELKGPRLDVEADADPREFMVEVISDGKGEPLGVSAFYFACNDDEGWCKPVTQRYAVYLEIDPDGGTDPLESSLDGTTN